MQLQLTDETSRLRSVILGIAHQNGPAPSLEEAYDPKSRVHIAQNTYPLESDMIKELDAFAIVLQRYEVQVFRPQIIEVCNQMFSRDIGFVIDDFFVKANILPDREREIQAIKHILSLIDPSKILTPPSEVHVEGGDVMLHGEHLFVGYYNQPDYAQTITARTNVQAVDWLGKQFGNKKVKAFELRKSNTDPFANALHLDCCFQPVGDRYAIIHKEGFMHQEDVDYLTSIFGAEQLFPISAQEMYEMNSNIFSISPTAVVSDHSFDRLNSWLRSKGITVEAVPFREIAKQEGLLRCTTLPLFRDPK
ncbi:MAG: arginine deiminase-related protein [Bacteroidetes bacterium]|nr:arginine deiminase-related protein [Bacteroidota bacterium]MDA0950275.1 arginine deiminase-related protein [Bacteroidota bacterium]